MTAPLTREQLLTLKPHAYLLEGFRDARGQARPELRGLWALASAEQLREAKVTAAELEPLVAAVSRVALDGARSPLPLAELEPLRAALQRQDAPSAARSLVSACLDAVAAREDLRPLVDHLAQVLRTLAMLEAMQRPEP